MVVGGRSIKEGGGGRTKEYREGGWRESGLLLAGRTGEDHSSREEGTTGS